MSFPESILSKDSSSKQHEQTNEHATVTNTDESKTLDEVSGYKLGVELEDVIEDSTTVIRTLDQLSPSDLVNLSPSELQTGLPEGWSYAAHGLFVHIRDATGTYRIRIDPPDKVTLYRHMHVMDAQGKPLNIAGEVVKTTSPEGHMAYNK